MGRYIATQKMICKRISTDRAMESMTNRKSCRHETCHRRHLRNMTSSNALAQACLFVLLLLSILSSCSAFQSTSTSTTCQIANRMGCIHSSSQTALCVFPGFNNNNNNNNDNNNGDEKKKSDDWNPNNIFESIKNLFGNNNSNNNNNNPSPIFSQFFQPPGLSSDDDYYDELGQFYETDEDYDDDEEDEEDELPAGTSLLFRIRAKQLKPGGLRLFLMFYLMGMQNTPDRNTWRADQRLMSVNVTPKGFEDDDAPEEEEEKKYVLEMLYDVDRTGMLQIELLPKKPHKQAEIRIYRCGSRPSTSYLMQESVIVDGVLDELQNISGEKDLTTTMPRSDNPNVGEPEIADEDRLLITDPPNAIEAARESLAFS